MWTARDNRIFVALMLALVALAWLSLVLWGHSPYGRYLSHDGLAEIEKGADAGLLVVFVGGWTLMTVAMMLPTSLPLVLLFRRLTASKADSGWLIVLLLGGYLAVWTLFGGVAHLADLLLHQLLDNSATLARYPWLLGSGTLLLAGIYQYTPLKYHCLDKCRSPLSFVMSRWSGRDERRDAFRLGLAHGLYCVGCCWSLMLVMFAVGVGSLAWMFILGAIMAVEKNLSWGRRFSQPLGTALLVAGIGITALALAA